MGKVSAAKRDALAFDSLSDITLVRIGQLNRQFEHKTRDFGQASIKVEANQQSVDTAEIKIAQQSRLRSQSAKGAVVDASDYADQECYREVLQGHLLTKQEALQLATAQRDTVKLDLSRLAKLLARANERQKEFQKRKKSAQLITSAIAAENQTEEFNESRPVG